ncbi:hypothetical protein Tco_1315480, partial [Tanacetum coccineum]
MYLNLWSYKVVRHRYSNLHAPAKHREDLPGIFNGIVIDSLSMIQKEKKFDTSAGNPVKEILLKLSLPDHRIFKDGGEVEIKQMEADDQAIQTILLGLLEDIYDAIDSCETAQEIWFTSTDGESIKSYYHQWSRHVTIVHQIKDLHIADYTQLYDFLKYNQKEVDELRAERLAKTQDPLALMANFDNPFNYPVFHPDLPSSSTYIQQPQPNNNYNPQPSYNQNYMQQPMLNPKDITDPMTAMNMELVLMAKAFKLNYSTPTNNNQRISSNPRNRQIAQPFSSESECSECLKSEWANCVTTAEDWVILLETAQSDQGEWMQLIFRLMDLDEIEEVNANYILMDNLQQASTSGTQSDNAPVYDTNGSAEVQLHENFYNNEIFNMFTQEE